MQLRNTEISNYFQAGLVTTIWAEKEEQQSIIKEILNIRKFQLIRFIDADSPNTGLNRKSIKRTIQKQSQYNFSILEEVLYLEETYRKYELDNWDYFKLELIQVILEQPSILFLNEPFQNDEFNDIFYALSDQLPNTTFVFFDGSLMAAEQSDEILEAYEILSQQKPAFDLVVLN